MATLAPSPPTEFGKWWEEHTTDGKRFRAEQLKALRQTRADCVEDYRTKCAQGEAAMSATAKALNDELAAQEIRTKEWIAIARNLDRLRHDNESARNTWLDRIARAEKALRDIAIPEINQLVDFADDRLRRLTAEHRTEERQAAATVIMELRKQVLALPMLPEDEARAKCDELRVLISDAFAKAN